MSRGAERYWPQRRRSDRWLDPLAWAFTTPFFWALEHGRVRLTRLAVAADPASTDFGDADEPLAS